MGRYLSILSGGKTINHKSGSTVTFDSGSTLTVSGTLSGVSIASPTNLDVSGTTRARTTLEVNGIASFGTHAAAECTISAVGAIATSGTLNAGVTTVTSLVIGNGAGTIMDTEATLTLTETNISLVGAVTASSLTSTGTLAATAACTVGTTLGVTGDVTVNTDKFAVNATTGVVTLANAAAIDPTVTDLVGIGAKVYFCNDTSPSAVPANACVVYYDGTDLKAKNAAGTATLNNAAFA